MCGEKHRYRHIVLLYWGSPPHVRGKEKGEPFEHRKTGITPACAGKSLDFQVFKFGGQDHPRMCGEKTKKIP